MASPTDFEATFELAGESVTYFSLAKAEAAGLGAFRETAEIVEGSRRELAAQLQQACRK